MATPTSPSDPESNSPEPGRAELSPSSWVGALAAWVLGHPRAAVGLALVLSVASALLATQLSVDPNMMALLPADHPTTQAIGRLMDEEGGANLVTIAFAGPAADEDAATTARRDAALHELAVDIEALPSVEYALYDIDADLAWELGLLGLSTEELSVLSQRLEGAVAMGPAAANPFVQSRLLALGPLSEKLSGAPTSTAVVQSDDGLARLLVRPTEGPYDPGFSGPLMADLHARIAAASAESPEVELIWVGGAYRHANEDLETIQHDLKSTAGVSALLVLGLIALAFRDWRATLLVFVPLLFANLWTTGFAAASVGRLTTFTSFYPAVLVGLGVDFSLHLYARYQEERRSEDSVQHAIVAAWDRSGPPCVTAAITSAGGFFALWVAGFGGFRQLGTLLGAGVLICLFSVLLLLPLLISWRDRTDGAVVAVPEATSTGTDTVSAWATDHAWAGLALVGMLTVTAATFLPGIDFEYDLSEMRSEGLAYDDLTEDERAAATSAFAPVVVSFDSDAELATAHTAITAELETTALPYVASVLSVHSLLPVDQPERVAGLSRVAELARHEHIAYLPEAVRDNLARIGRHTPRVLTADHLPAGLRHVLGAAAPRPRLTVLPQGNQWDLRENARLRDAIAERFSEGQAAGEYLALAVLYELVRDDVPWVAGTALLVVFLLSWADLRRAGRALATVAVLAAGMAWAGAGMVGADIRLSMVNFVGIPILMGIGVDVIIHLMHRVHEEGPGQVGRALRTTGWASGLSAATTMLSFAALSVAEHQGVRSLGQLIVLGLGLVTLAGFVVVPLGWSARWRWSATPSGGETGTD